jgi:RNA polymerase sigma-70 factor, ECF subfamily
MSYAGDAMQPESTRARVESELGVLVERARHGERAAEAEVCRAVTPAIRVYAARRLGTADAVDEFTQDALVVVVEALRAGRIVDPDRVGLFVLGVCRNFARERARKSERRRELWNQHAPLLETRSEPAELVPRARLEDCLGRLTQRTREVLHRAFVEVESHAEIGMALGLSEGNARVVRHRALAALRECLEPGVQEGVS